MSYPDLDRGDLLDDLLNRKEMFSLKADSARNFRDPPEGRNDPLSGKYLKIHSHQLFARNFINPNTPYKRLHLLHTPGTGKTLGAVSIAYEFIKVYRKMYASTVAKTQAGRKNYAELDRTTPTVFVLGFGGTKAAFVRELLKHPNFGFVSLTEKEELIKRHKIADAGLPDDIKHLREYYSYLKKRITNKSKDGFFKFFGYDEFVNRLFVSDSVKLIDLEAIAIQKLKAGENVTLEDVFYDHIRSGTIQVNHQLLAMFTDSLLICDEIHNTYNMNMKNNRGVAIQFLLDSVPNLRFLSLSATPINNSPTEIVELVNYLVPADQKITKKGFFLNNRELLPGKLAEIGRLTRGRISFLQDVNMKYFPRREFIGEPLAIPKQVDAFPAGSFIPYLKFIPCPMSKLHQVTYDNYLANVNADNPTDTTDDNNIDTIDTIDTDIVVGIDAPTYTYHSIPTDGYSIYDITFPSPESDTVGIFRSSEVRNKISLASQEWRDRIGIMVKKYSAINNVITGDFLRRESIGQYSSKCKTLLDTVFDIMAQSNGDVNECQKIMIYHDRVKMSGVLLLQELLRTNNFIDEYSEPVDSTICCICGESLAAHNKPAQHAYRPARFVMAHSDVDKVIMDQSLAKFNSPDNAHGLNYMILIGSKIIKESYDFKDIQNLIVMSLPTSIPILIQVFGRCIRKGSHIHLPPAHRKVSIRILCSTVNTQYSSGDSISPEMYRYIDKLSDYIVIQNIERELNRNAIDADIHWDIIMPPDLKAEYFPEGRGPIDTLGNLYFEPATRVPNYELKDLNLTTFNAYRYYEEEIRTISYLIKRLFMMRRVWTYDDLWAAVRAPPIGVEVNPALFTENNFIIALHNLINLAATIISAAKQRPELTETFLIERIFDYSERYIWIGGQRHKIEQVSKYYILFPVSDLPANPLNIVYAEYMEHIRDKERAMIKELVEPNDQVLMDVETYLRRVNKRAGVRIGIDAFVRDSKADINYMAKKARFVSEYGPLDDIVGFLTNFSAQFQMSFVEEAITFAMFGTAATVEGPDTHGLYMKVIALLGRFRVIVVRSEVAKYRDTAKQYKNGLPGLPADCPLGYMTAKTVRLFDPQVDLGSTVVSPETVERGRWIEVSKIALNRHTSFKENDIIVGYLESAEDSMRFKLRKPAHLIKEDIAKEAHARKISKSETDGSAARTAVGDTRLIERGIVCKTKNKRNLLQIMAALGLSVSKMDRGEIRIRRLCDAIKKKLMDNEMKERQRDSRYKYMYFWWDENINIAGMI